MPYALRLAEARAAPARAACGEDVSERPRPVRSSLLPRPGAPPCTMMFFPRDVFLSQAKNKSQGPINTKAIYDAIKAELTKPRAQ